MINPVNHFDYNTFTFKKNSKKSKPSPQLDDKNPISRRGEALTLITATFLGGIGVAVDSLLSVDVLTDIDVIDDITKLTESLKKKKKSKAQIDKAVEKAKQQFEENANRGILKTVGGVVALFVAGISGFALLYTLYNSPKIAYQSKVNSFKKGKDMDVYIKSNIAERELYSQLDEKAKVSNSEEKEKLKEQYMQLKLAKNQVPDFVKINLPN